VEIGTVAAPFLFREYLNGIFVAVWCDPLLQVIGEGKSGMIFHVIEGYVEGQKEE
jgi:hypothetical protein